MTRRQVLGLVMLCLWSSAAWLTADLLPARMGAVAGQGVHFLLIGVLALLVQGAGGGWGLPAGLVWSGAGGFGLVGVPLLFLYAAEGKVSPTLGVVVFSLVPVAVLVGLGRLGMLFPALAGVAGVLLLVPSSLPGSVDGWEGLGFLLVAAGCTAAGLVSLPKAMRGVALGWVVAGTCLLSGLVFVGLGLLSGPGDWAWGAVGLEMIRGLVLDLPEVVLLLWLLKVTPPERVAVRYLVTPLFTVLEGFAMLRPGLDGRTVAGVVLLAAGSWWLLRQEAEEKVGLGLI